MDCLDRLRPLLGHIEQDTVLQGCELLLADDSPDTQALIQQHCVLDFARPTLRGPLADTIQPRHQLVAALRLLQLTGRLRGVRYLNLSADVEAHLDAKAKEQYARVRNTPGFQGWFARAPQIGLRALPPAEYLTALQELKLGQNNQLVDLSPLSACTELRELDLSHCTAVESVSPVRAHPKLSRLDLRGCTSLRGIDLELPQLEVLGLGGNRRVSRFRLEGGAGLTRLDLSSFQHLETLELPALPKLEVLYGAPGSVLSLDGGYPALRRLEGSGVRVLAVADLPSLVELSPPTEAEQVTLRSLPALRGSLKLSARQIELHSLPSLSGLLEVDARTLSMSSLPNLSFLQLRVDRLSCSDVSVQHWCQVEKPIPLHTLPACSTLMLEDASTLDGIGSLRISRLHIGDSPGLTDLAPLAAQAALQELRIGSIGAEDLTPLGALHALEALQIIVPERATDLSWFAGLTQLKKLWIIPQASTTELPPLAARGLTELQLHRAPSLADVSALAGMTSLVDLFIRECPQLRDLSPLEGLHQLKRLTLWDTDPPTLNALRHLDALEELTLINNPTLADISAILGLPSLETLDIHGCPNVPADQIRQPDEATEIGIDIGGRDGDGPIGGRLAEEDEL